MARTNIPWTDYTYNPWWGCDRVSAGCIHCYIPEQAPLRVKKQKHGDPRVRAGEGTLLAPLWWNHRPWVCDGCGETYADTMKDGTFEICPACFHQTSESVLHRARVFLGSLMDIFDPQVPIEWFAGALDMVRQCPNLNWLLVTKRPENFALRMIEASLWAGGYRDGQRGSGPSEKPNAPLLDFLMDWSKEEVPPKNVWVIASTENQQMLEKRVPELLKIPAVVRGLSCEPLLGPLDLEDVIVDRSAGEHHINCLSLEGDDPLDDCDFAGATVDWVIAGGESGSKARPCEVDWLRSIQKQCQAAGVPYFCKQLGRDPQWSARDIEERWHERFRDKKGGKLEEFPLDMRVREYPNAFVKGRFGRVFSPEELAS